VDAGVDTGAIVMERELPIQAGDTIAILRRKAENLGAEMMAEIVDSIIEAGAVMRVRQQQRGGTQYYRMPRTLLRQAEDRLRYKWKPPA
jgi:methionyl-tRNA formyltransferase